MSSSIFWFLLPLVIYSQIILISAITISSSRSCRNLCFRVSRSALVSRPCTRRALSRRFLPSGVFAPLDAPPWFLQTRLPCMAGFLHCDWLRLLRAWQRGQVIRPPRVLISGSLSIIHSTSWTVVVGCRNAGI